MARKDLQGKIYLMPLGNLNPSIPENLLDPLENRFDYSCSLAPPIPDIGFACNSPRNQYLSTALLRKIAAMVPVDGIRTLGVADA